jgi:hypothetical protein
LVAELVGILEMGWGAYSLITMPSSEYCCSVGGGKVFTWIVITLQELAEQCKPAIQQGRKTSAISAGD